MKRYLPVIYLIIITIQLLLLSSCQKLDKLDDLSATDVDAEYAIPLFSTDFKMGEILENFDENSSVFFDENGSAILRYQGDFTSSGSRDIFDVLSVVNNIPIPLMDTVSALPFVAPNGVMLDYAILKTGGFRYVFSSEHEEPITVSVSIPSMTKNGEIFSHTLGTTAYSGTIPVAGGLLSPLDLSGYTLDIPQDSIYVEFSAFRENSGFADTLAGFAVIFNDVTASFIQGYLGNQVFEFDRDTIEIDFFENWTEGTLRFEDPTINFMVDNSFGFPVRSSINVLDIISVNDRIFPLSSPFIANGIDFAYPQPDEVGCVKQTFFSFDNENSNLVELLSAVPKAVDYDIDGLTNPDGNTAIRGFMTDSSLLSVQVEVVLPVFGAVSNYNVFDTIKIDRFDFDVDFEQYGAINYAEFKLYSESDIPLDIDLQLLFADQNEQVIDSLFTDLTPIVKAAEVNSEGNTIAPTIHTVLSRVTEGRFERIREEARFLFLRVRFATPEDGMRSVRVTADQGAKIGMGVKVGVIK